MALTPGLPASLTAAELGEYEIKSGMLFNFTSFIVWPAQAADQSNTLTICLTANNPANRSFERLQGKQSNNRKLTIRAVSTPQSTKGCNVLFISSSESSHLAAYLKEVQNKPVLTVSDIENFTANGGMIGFYEDLGKIRFEINFESSQQSGLQIKSQLLKLAKIVKTSR